MRIGIIGAGAVGGTLARGLAKLGHDVVIANSRGPSTLREFGTMAVSVREAARAGEVVIVAIPTKAVTELPPDLFAGVPSSVALIDTGNYHPELRDGRIEALEGGMPDSEWVAEKLGRPVVKAFNNILATSLAEKAGSHVALSVAGDPPTARALVLRLVAELGFDPVDAGALAESWRQQTGTPAYCRDLDAASLRRALAEADRSRLAEYRREREENLRRLM